MNKFEIGDRVSVLDDAIDGVVVSTKNKEITIETTDGFVMTYFVNELVKVNNSRILSDINTSGALAKKKNDLQPTRKQVELKNKLEKVEKATPEFDLHIEKLVKNFSSMTNYEILNLQIETAKRHIEFALKNRIPKIVFIHGVGEGILKSDLEFMLKRYDNISFQDGSFQKYGMGATEVYIKQNK